MSWCCISHVLQGPQNFRTQALASLHCTIVSVYKDHGKVNTEVNLPYMKTFDGVGMIFTTIIVIGVSLSKPHINKKQLMGWLYCCFVMFISTQVWHWTYYSACVLFVDVKKSYRLTVQRHHWHCWLCSYCHNIISSGLPPVFLECTGYTFTHALLQH